MSTTISSTLHEAFTLAAMLRNITPETILARVAASSSPSRLSRRSTVAMAASVCATMTSASP
jgi:hypothetical protein